MVNFISNRAVHPAIEQVYPLWPRIFSRMRQTALAILRQGSA
jgi:hypothetical protein